METHYGGIDYKYFPNIALMEKELEVTRSKNTDNRHKAFTASRVASLYAETLVMSNLLKEGFNFDFDGDKVAVTIILTKEANDEALAFLRDPQAFFSLDGKNQRKVLNKDSISGIYGLTIDSKDIRQYKKVVDFLNWLDHNSDKIKEKKKRFTLVLNEIYEKLIKKEAESNTDRLLLSVYNLIKSYKNSSFALGPISFDIKEGQIIGLVGENGNGKTTLLRSLCRELQPTSGEIKYLFPYSDNYDLRSKLIYIPQRTASWQGSLLSNLRFTATSYGIIGEENILKTELIIARMGLRKYRDYSWKNL